MNIRPKWPKMVLMEESKGPLLVIKLQIKVSKDVMLCYKFRLYRSFFGSGGGRGPPRPPLATPLTWGVAIL